MSTTTTPKPEKPLPQGTTPPFARMHRYLQRGLMVCLIALVIEGAFTMPLLAIYYGFPTLSFKEICSELRAVQIADPDAECQFPIPLGAKAENQGQTTAKDTWGVQPKPQYKRIGFRELVTIHEERLARQAAAGRADPATP
jgi:hypothetical protein